MICIVTGVNGGIGHGIATGLKRSGYFVFGIDVQEKPLAKIDAYCQIDLASFSSDVGEQKELIARIEQMDMPVTALINNAAVQYCADLELLNYEECLNAFEVNVFAPIFLTKCIESFLRPSSSLINISSIHDHLTKPNFLVYASTKGAMTSFTKALSVQYSNKFRVFGVRPAAIDTPMLRSGFSGDVSGFDRLNSYHPTKEIGSIEDVTNLLLFLIKNSSQFLSGSVFDICGGIQNRLHDPV